MTRLVSRVGASAVGTNTQLAASTLKLEPGERWFRTDSPNVTDNTSPFYNLPNPATQWKTGIGNPADSSTWKTYSQLLFDPIGTGGGGGGGGTPEINPVSVLGNSTADLATGASLRINPDPEDDTIPNLRSIMGALTSSDLNPLSNAIGTLTDAEITAGGLRNIINSFIAVAGSPTRTLNATFTSGSSTVTVSSPLPAEIGQFAYVMGPSTHIPNNGFQYVGAIASDRMSFTLSSTSFSLAVPPVSTPVNASASGTVSVRILYPFNSVHGVWLSTILNSNPATGDYLWRNHGNPLSGSASTSLDVTTRVKDGHLYHKSAMTTGAQWEQQTGGVETVIPIMRTIAAVGTSSFTWTSQPASDTEFLGEATFRHRFRMWIPDTNYTQLMFWIDVLLTAGSTNSKMRIDFWNTVTSAWADTTNTRANVPLTGTLDEGKDSGWQTIHADLMAQAALETNRMVRCRIVGNSSNGAGSPAFGNVGYSLQ